MHHDEDEEFLVEPDNHQLVDLWLAMDSQWRLAIGFAGCCWQAPEHVNAWSALKAMGVKKRNRQGLFRALCDMEQEALQVLNAED